MFYKFPDYPNVCIQSQISNKVKVFFSKVSPTNVDAQLNALKPLFKEVDHVKTGSPSNRSENTVTTISGELADASHHVLNIWEDKKVTGR